MSVLNDSETSSRHVHFPVNLNSGSHRSPEEFRIPRRVDDNNNNNQDQRIFFVVRSNVPFDSWFNRLPVVSRPLEGFELWQARFNALYPLGLGIAYSLIEAVNYIFAYIFTPAQSSSHYEALKAQWHGISLSAWAVISPNGAREQFLDYWRNPTA